MPKLRTFTSDTDVTPRLLPRSRGGPIRYYADFRDYADVGGKVEKLAPPGQFHATTDFADAKAYAESWLAELIDRRNRQPVAASKTRTFGTFAAYHLAQKAINQEADAQWLDSAQRHLEVARDYFGEDTDLARIQVADVTKYVGHLRKRSNGRGGTMSSGTSVHYLNSVSNMFDRAISEGIVKLGANPVSAMVSKPKITRKKTLWLEVHEMASILKFAKEYVPARGDLAIPYFFEILAGYALTGMRESELLGLQVSDVDLERLVISVDVNPWRRVKTENSQRSIPIHPQLAEIWGAYLSGPHKPTGLLMFPAIGDGSEPEKMIVDLRRMFDKMPMPPRFTVKRTPEQLKEADEERLKLLARWDTPSRGPKPKISREELLKPVSATVLPPLRTKILRHTYCAARLQTMDGGKAISQYTVAEEMGHEDFKMIKKVYGHLGKIRHRADAVEYRWQQRKSKGKSEAK